MGYKPATPEEVEELIKFLNEPLPADQVNHSAAAERIVARSFEQQGIPIDQEPAAAPIHAELVDDEGIEGMRGKLLNSPNRYIFILAGNAVFTVLNTETGNRFTFKITQPREPNDDGSAKPHFVKVLTGPDNYSFLGTIFNKITFKHGRNSRISEDAQSAKVFSWFWKRLMDGRMPEYIEVWHEGRCGACGRALTVPESIERGLWPHLRREVLRWQTYSKVTRSPYKSQGRWLMSFRMVRP